MRYAGVFAFVCAGAQAFAYTKSYLTADQPIHCMAVPFGECQSILASGYAKMVPGPVSGFEISNALATGVPLLMWLAVVVSAHNPQMRMRREGKSKLAPAPLGLGFDVSPRIPPSPLVGAPPGWV